MPWKPEPTRSDLREAGICVCAAPGMADESDSHWERFRGRIRSSRYCEIKNIVRIRQQSKEEKLVEGAFATEPTSETDLLPDTFYISDERERRWLNAKTRRNLPRCLARTSPRREQRSQPLQHFYPRQSPQPFLLRSAPFPTSSIRPLGAAPSARIPNLSITASWTRAAISPRGNSTSSSHKNFALSSGLCANDSLRKTERLLRPFARRNPDSTR